MSSDLFQGDITMCRSSGNGATPELETSTPIGLLPGRGSFHVEISSQSDSARIYFDQGLLMYYSFHMQEAAASFAKAITFDSTCAMLYWGQALCYDKNGMFPYTQNPTAAVRAIKKATTLLGAMSPFEIDIIKATFSLISDSTNANEEKSKELFEMAMKKVFMKYPDNPEAATFYSLARTWNLPSKLGQEKNLKEKTLGLLYDTLLRKFPRHPALHHHFIHFIESREQFQKGLGSAEVLLKNYGGISHMVHMASHIYIRSGDYREGVQVNEDAIRLFRNYMSIYPALESGPGRFLHINHARHMAYANAMMLADYNEAELISSLEAKFIDQQIIQRKRKLRDTFQYEFMHPRFAFVRYGKWDSILAKPNLPDSLAYARYIQTFCKGFALARLKKGEEANRQLDSLLAVQLSKASTTYLGVNKLSDYLQIMVPFLSAIISEEAKKFVVAEKYYHEAILREDSLLYDDPIQWYLPVRQYLGNMYLKEKLFKKAETQFREDLQHHPANVWSLRGLLLALEGQKKFKESRLVELRVKNINKTFDTVPVGAVF